MSSSILFDSLSSFEHFGLIGNINIIKIVITSFPPDFVSAMKSNCVVIQIIAISRMHHYSAIIGKFELFCDYLLYLCTLDIRPQ